MKKFMAFFIFACSTAFADPIVFGLEVGKTTEKELKEMYPVKEEGLNKWNKGRMYSVSPRNINFEGLQNVLTIFDLEGKLVAVIAKFPKEKFDYLKQALDSKYSLVESQIPFVGNKYVAYCDGLTKISVYSPHMDYLLTMNYFSQPFLDSYEEQSRHGKQEKQVAEQSQL